METTPEKLLQAIGDVLRDRARRMPLQQCSVQLHAAHAFIGGPASQTLQ